MPETGTESGSTGQSGQEVLGSPAPRSPLSFSKGGGEVKRLPFPYPLQGPKLVL